MGLTHTFRMRLVGKHAKKVLSLTNWARFDTYPLIGVKLEIHFFAQRKVMSFTVCRGVTHTWDLDF